MNATISKTDLQLGKLEAQLLDETIPNSTKKSIRRKIRLVKDEEKE